MSNPINAVGGHPPHKFALAQDSLSYREHAVHELTPSGAVILHTAGLSTDGDVSLFVIDEQGNFENISLDRHVHLRADRDLRFVAFHSDREFRFMLDARQIVWGHARLAGEVLYALASAESNEIIVQRVPDAADRVIERGDEIDLSFPGVEHFGKRKRPSHDFHIVVNGHEESVKEPRVTFEQLVALAYPGQPSMPNITYSITFRKVASVPHSGELAEGGHVEVQNGSIFNVGRTIQS